MMLKDFNLSKRSSLNVTWKLTDCHWLPILKSSSPLNALMTTLLNQLQNEKDQDGISAQHLDCATTNPAIIPETQKR
jgi:hypothetical protein